MRQIRRREVLGKPLLLFTGLVAGMFYSPQKAEAQMAFAVAIKARDAVRHLEKRVAVLEDRIRHWDYQSP